MVKLHMAPAAAVGVAVRDEQTVRVIWQLMFGQGEAVSHAQRGLDRAYVLESGAVEDLQLGRALLIRGDDEAALTAAGEDDAS